MLQLVRLTALIFSVLAALVVFVYSPFYSKVMLKALNQFVPVQVNPVAANSQKAAALTVMDGLEPGSELWIARQAYLKVMQQQMHSPQANTLALVHARYQLLQDKIKAQQEEKIDDIQLPLILDEQAASSAEQPYVFTRDESQSQALMQQYLEFLSAYPIDPQQTTINDEIFEDITFLQQQQTQSTQHSKRPYAIVVLGGGLTLAEDGKNIVVNSYTRLRLETALATAAQYPTLPIVLSGVEAPYMQDWLKVRGVDAQLLENRSMNTCENSRFSALLLQKQGGAPRVFLVTDAYHMPRTRRLFALNGIDTVPIQAPMPTPLTKWQPSMQNYDHSRRANYEMLATLRDVVLGSSDCREVP